MAVDEINTVNSALLTILQSRARNPGLLTDTPLSALTPAPAVVAAPKDLTPAQQAALLVNETLQGLAFAPLSPAETLLINETDPNLAAGAAAQDLTPVQQAALSVNETLQTLSATETTAPPAAAGNMRQGLNPGLLDTPLIGTAVAEVATRVEVDALTLKASASAGAQTAALTPEATTASQDLNPTPSAVQPILDRNPIAVPVYEIRDQNPAPSAPKPRRREVLPSLPIGRVRPVDRLVLRQEWERRKEQGRREGALPRLPLAEISIRQMVSQANEDLAANGLPLRLVLAKSNEDYSLDIYDCSDDEVCRLAQEVPLDLNELLTILDNIQHETGMIINIRT